MSSTEQGISVELREGQGITISQIQDGARFSKDGRIAVGDLLLVINHENIRKASTAQAQTVLRRTSLLSSEIRRSADLLLAINHENIRKASTAQAQTVLRRTSLLSSEISVTFVKAGDIPEYKRSLQAHDSHPATPKLPVQISPRIFPQYYR
ncbi:uncharacterized protein LOC103516436 [Diaphorina citri]|uniref:Uncharacterized protein LOC103516436 n=1 Tax=Diaphorina citri TaxID=121845 RepID=A0A3Q0J839_DIACI|nr:uncharacterized protein LOC103516436 [Diaphorina citri]